MTWVRVWSVECRRGGRGSRRSRWSALALLLLCAALASACGGRALLNDGAAGSTGSSLGGRAEAGGSMAAGAEPGSVSAARAGAGGGNPASASSGGGIAAGTGGGNAAGALAAGGSNGGEAGLGGAGGSCDPALCAVLTCPAGYNEEALVWGVLLALHANPVSGLSRRAAALRLEAPAESDSAHCLPSGCRLHGGRLGRSLLTTLHRYAAQQRACAGLQGGDSVQRQPGLLGLSAAGRSARLRRRGARRL